MFKHGVEETQDFHIAWAEKRKQILDTDYVRGVLFSLYSPDVFNFYESE